MKIYLPIISMLLMLLSYKSYSQEDPQLNWQFGMLGHDLGEGGILISDIDDDGVNEIISSGRYSGSYWEPPDFFTVVSYDQNQQRYTTEWISSVIAAKIKSMALYDYNQDGSKELYLGLDDGTIAIYDLTTYKRVQTLNTSYRGRVSDFDSPNVIQHIEFGDANNDQSVELVASNGDTTYIFDSQLKLAFKIPAGAPHFKIGNIDDDGENEIIYSDGSIIQLVGQNILEKYTFDVEDAGLEVGLAQIDDDGILDVVYGSNNSVYAYNFNLNQLIWQSSWESPNQERYITGIWLSDYNKDQVTDVLVGDQREDLIFGINGSTGEEEFAFRVKTHDPPVNVAVANLDMDAALEIIWSVGAACTCSDHFFIVDLETELQEWQSRHWYSDFKAFDVGDVDNDGEAEIIVANTGEYATYYEYSFISIFDAKTKMLEKQNNEEISRLRDDFTATKIGDVNNDGQNELLVGVETSYAYSNVYALNENQEIINEYRINGMNMILGIEIADIDLDNENEVIVTTGTNILASTDPERYQNYIYVFDGKTNEVEWKSPLLDGIYSKVGSVKIGNIDDDEALEVIALQYESRKWETQLLIYDGVSQELTAEFLSINAFDVTDLDSDGIDDILVGMNSGEIGILERDTWEIATIYSGGSGKINSLAAVDFNGDGNKEFVYSDDYKLYIYDPLQSSIKWQSDTINYYGVGRYNSLKVQDLDMDGAIDILLNTEHALYNYEVMDYESLRYVSSGSQGIITGLQPIDYEKRLPPLLYPNPFQNELYIKHLPSSVSISYQLYIYSLQGERIHFSQGQLVNNENLLGTASLNLKGGAYLYRLHIDDTQIYSGLIMKAD
ncbi:MAG: T9SS type A sorting domain-containing protein [Cyclobacteriaceae bacterium]